MEQLRESDPRTRGRRTVFVDAYGPNFSRALLDKWENRS
jgi:hypothetical protein